MHLAAVATLILSLLAQRVILLFKKLANRCSGLS